VQLTPVSTAVAQVAAAQAAAGAIGEPAPALVDVPGRGRSLSPSDAVPEPFLYRNLEEVANKLGAASCPGDSPIPPCTQEFQKCWQAGFAYP
jgi:hypothetical protein